VTARYVEQRDGGYYVAGTRVSLDSIVYAFLEGQTAESIAQAFSALTLEQAYGAITFYLAHRPEVDQYLEGARRDFETRCFIRSSQPLDGPYRPRPDEGPLPGGR
jgi:uncharacterized protein (DUF433 family)